MKNKIAIVIGTRPEIIKMSPLIKQCTTRNIEFVVIHSNQHYSKEMDAIFFSELELPLPKYNLNVGSGLHGEMTAKIISGVEKILIKEKPTWVLVQGDTNTVLGGALAASKLQIKIGHLEAGLRSYDRSMPEEINRIVTDHISDLLFAPTQKQAEILIGEGVESQKIIVTGNTIVDAVFENHKLVKKHPKFDHYQFEKYFLLTTHRPSNVDDKMVLNSLLSVITKTAILHNCFVYFPAHPRTMKQINYFGIKVNNKYLKIIDPVGYLEMLALEKNAELIFTDSGGIQEEACILQVPSIVLRDNTERPEALEVGSSMLVHHRNKEFISDVTTMIKKRRNWQNPFGDGNSANNILDGILKYNPLYE
jgi:UDP-N-acetylglucosamine 2-epimerase (non-hydrolysing)